MCFRPVDFLNVAGLAVGLATASDLRFPGGIPRRVFAIFALERVGAFGSQSYRGLDIYLRLTMTSWWC